MTDPSREWYLREAVIEDANGIAKASVETWQSAYAQLVSPGTLEDLSVERRATGFRDRLPDKSRICIVAEASGRIVGFADGGPNELDGEALLQALYVLPAFQRKGIGEALLRTFALEAKERGFGALRLFVLDGNKSARAFYEKLGGQEAGESLHEIAGIAYPTISLVWCGEAFKSLRA